MMDLGSGGTGVTLNEVKGTISSMAPFASLRVTSWYAPRPRIKAAA
jgi:hypothetical protein